MAVELAIVMGASVVYAVDPVKDRRTRAASLGAIPVPPEELVETVREATNGLMVDCVLEAVGKTGTVDLAMATVGVGRNVSILGAGMDLEVKVPFEAILNGVTVRANMLTEISRFWPELVPLLQSGRIHPEKVITDRVTLEQGPEAYRRVAAREDGVSKVVLTA